MFLRYYQAFLDARSCKWAEKVTRGCPQGSSLSSLAFVVVFQAAVDAMEAKGYFCTLFADDAVFAHSPDISKDVVLREFADLIQSFGLKLVFEKCASTQDGGEITFLGQTFSQHQSFTLAERL